MPRGGRRPGAGMKPLYGVAMVRVTIALTPGQKARLEALGGSAWVREQLGPVEEPAGVPDSQLDLLEENEPGAPMRPARG